MSTPYYKLMDLVCVLAAALFAYWLRFGELKLPTEYIVPTSVLTLSATLSLSLFGFYGTTNSEASSRRLIAAISGLALAVLITTMFMYLTKTGQTFSRIWFVTTFGTTLAIMLSYRVVLAKLILTSYGKRGIIVIGDNHTAQLAESTLNSASALKQGLVFIHRFRPQSPKKPKRAIRAAINFVLNQASESQIPAPVTEVWISSDIFSNQSALELELMMSDISATVVYLPEMPAVAEFDMSRLDSVLGIPTFNSNHRKTHKLNTVLKYIEDKIGALLLLTLTLPLMLVVSILIKIDSKGPVFYKQPRHGFGGREFHIFKFRTMYSTKDDQTFRQAVSNDPRITRVGKWLRRSSIDELPQLINVLNGSMSLVGPRPHPVKLNRDFQHEINRYMVRHAVKPGITGLAQVRGFRGETPSVEMMNNRVKYDLDYVHNWSVLLDIKILVATVSHVLITDRAL